MTPYPFERTACDCSECVRPCHEQPGPLVPGDLERIAAHLGKSVRVAALKFWASPGSLLLNQDTGETMRVGSITPQRRNGRCVFLDEHDRCTIHAVAPAGCALFDVHMDVTEARTRGMWVSTQMMDDTYQSLRRTLPDATSYKPRGYGAARPRP